MSKPKIAIIILLICYGGLCCVNRHGHVVLFIQKQQTEKLFNIKKLRKKTV